MSEVKNIPILRFPEFQGSWDKKTLGEIGEIVNGITYNPSQIQESGVLVLRSSNVQGGRLSFEDNVFITVDKYNPVKLNDILICVRNGSQRLIGKNAIINKEFDQVGFGAFMTVYRSDFNPFLQHWFQTKDYYKNVHKNLGATINSINGSDLKKFKVPFPKSNEQKKIADFLTAVDKRIELLEKKKTLLETYKKGVMKKIFNQEIRFKDDNGNDFPDWEEKRLGDVSECLDNQRKPLNDSERQNMKGDIPYWGANNIMDYINEYIFNEPIVLLAEDGGNFNDFKDRPIANYYTKKCWVNNHTHVLKGKKDLLDTKFLFFSVVHKNIIGFVSGGTRSKLTKSEMLKIPLGLPCVMEQKKISEFLSSIDNQIELLETQIDKSQTWKKGLLQKMFV